VDEETTEGIKGEGNLAPVAEVSQWRQSLVEPWASDQKWTEEAHGSRCAVDPVRSFVSRGCFKHRMPQGTERPPVHAIKHAQNTYHSTV
jgi:hypothetical protein